MVFLSISLSDFGHHIRFCQLDIRGKITRNECCIYTKLMCDNPDIDYFHNILESSLTVDGFRLTVMNLFPILITVSSPYFSRCSFDQTFLKTLFNSMNLNYLKCSGHVSLSILSFSDANHSRFFWALKDRMYSFCMLFKNYSCSYFLF